MKDELSLFRSNRREPLNSFVLLFFCFLKSNFMLFEKKMTFFWLLEPRREIRMRPEGVSVKFSQSRWRKEKNDRYENVEISTKECNFCPLFVQCCGQRHFSERRTMEMWLQGNGVVCFFKGEQHFLANMWLQPLRRSFVVGVFISSVERRFHCSAHWLHTVRTATCGVWWERG